MTAAQRQIILKKKESGVGVLLIDCQGKSNVLTATVMYELGRALDYVMRDPEIVALAVLSGKAHTFCSGADLHEIIKFTDKTSAHELSRQGQAVLRKLSNLGKPAIVGIHGSCIGGGLELALWCQRRIATNHPHTLMGLPEVKLGLIPGLGGTQRLPRLIGIKAAVEMILSGEPITAARAKEIGLVDDLVAADDLVEAAERTALTLARAAALPAVEASAQAAPAEISAEKQNSFFAMIERSIRIKTKGHYPAPYRAIEAIKQGMTSGLDAGLDLEAQAFAELAVGDVARNLIYLFFNTEFTRQASAQLAARQEPGTRIGIIGGGTMGAGIACAAAQAGFQVMLKEVSDDRLSQAMASIKAAFHKQAHKSKLAPAEIEQALGRIEGIVDEEALRGADLIVEAAFEDLSVKQDIFRRLSAVAPPHCVFATNTSSLSVARIAEALSDRGRLVGIHFFHPVDKMPLVEVIVHSGTRRDMAGQAIAFVSRLGKTPVTVADAPGFLVNRLLCVYLLQAARLAEAGAPLNWIEDVAIDFGMPMGPLVLLDEVGLDIAFKVAGVLHESLGSRYKPPAVFEKVKKLGLSGKKTGAGIYSWDESGTRLGFDNRLTAELGLRLVDGKADARSAARICDHLILPVIDEAARCLAEKVVRRARELDMAMVLGIGFPAFRGGPLRYADAIGIAQVRSRLAQIYEELPPPREVCEQILRMDSQGRRFYSLDSQAATVG